MESTIGLKSILGWELLPLFGRYGYVEMIKCLTTKTFPFCRLSTELPVHSVCGRLCSIYRIATSIRRSVHDWKLRQGILFPNMDGRIAYGSVPPVRRFYIYFMLCNLVFTLSVGTFLGCVHPSYAETGCKLNDH
jgi:hypothetical protein